MRGGRDPGAGTRERARRVWGADPGGGLRGPDPGVRARARGGQEAGARPQPVEGGAGSESRVRGRGHGRSVSSPSPPPRLGWGPPRGPACRALAPRPSG